MILLSACSEDKSAKDTQTQRYYFTQSLELVESAGRKLQNPSLQAQGIVTALATMDEGLKLSFHVEAEFLARFDPRLAKNYQRYFVKGVEAYRLGIEAGDSEEQKKGLQLLSQWAQFWAEAGQQIMQTM
ncbi:MAG: hypothetical protein GY784_09405 [Gammaproteobacteria bacterium]|nr:hypothetical protein [Gammaproteobacteria bacterium]